MRTIVDDSKTITFEVRGLTRREVRQLQSEDGIDLMDVHAGNATQALDKTLTIVLTEDENQALDDLPHFLFVRIFRAVLQETYGSRDEEKN